MNDERVKKAAETMLGAIAGMPVDEATAAFVSALGTASGGLAQMSGEPMETAVEMIEYIAIDAELTVRKHWGSFEATPLPV